MARFIQNRAHDPICHDTSAVIPTVGRNLNLGYAAWVVGIEGEARVLELDLVS